MNSTASSTATLAGISVLDFPGPTYDSYIGGRDVPSTRHVYTVATSAILSDVFAALTLKRRLEQGTADPAAAAGFVVGRCALADEHDVVAASEAAAAAAPAWRDSILS